MPDQTNLVQSIYSAIFNGVGSSGAQDASNYLCLEWPGMPVTDAEYGNPWSASNSNGNPQAEENFSVLVDAIPNLSPVYEVSGLGVESVYSMILMATVGSATPSPAISQQFAAAQQTFANAAIGGSSNPAALYHPSYSMPADWTNPSSSGWTKIDVQLGTPPPAPPPTKVTTAINAALLTQANAVGWRSAAIDVNQVRKINVPVRVSPVQIHPLIKSAAQPMSTQRMAFVAEPAAAAVKPVAAPAAASSVSPALQAQLNRMAQVRTVNEVLAKPAVPQRALSPALVNKLQAGPTRVIQPISTTTVATQPVQSKPITSSSLKLSMYCQRVTIRRDWMNQLLLQLGDWSIDGVPAGTLSNGATDNTNTGPFALLPLSFVVVRDVSITGTWSADDKTYATQAATPGNVVAFGPLTLANAATSQSTFDGSTLTVPGMQIVAWSCHPTPKLPPL